MTIEVHQPELEALIHQRMASGRFQSIEHALIAALRLSPDTEQSETPSTPKKNFNQFLRESPLWNSGLEFNRNKDLPRPITL